MPDTEEPKGNGTIQETKNQENSVIPQEEFKPTRTMKAWLQTTLELGYAASITEIAEKLKVDPSNWYKWLGKDGFVEWWDGQMQKILHQNRWKLDQIGLKQAKTKYNYWKDMMNRTGNTIPEQGNAIQVNQQFNMPNANMERITRQD